MKRYPIKTPNLVTYMLPKRRWNFSRKEKSIYLTFDDGPIAELTPWVLDVLHQYGAKATFFLIGDNVQKHPEIARSIIEQGHSVGNHTQQHLKGSRCTIDAYLNQVARCNTSITKALQIPELHIDLFRPPYGSLTQSQARALTKLNYKIVMWDILSADFDPKISPSQCAQNVIKHAKNGSIVVFHDSLKAQDKLRFALPQVLTHFSDLGYQFKCIPLQDQ